MGAFGGEELLAPGRAERDVRITLPPPAFGHKITYSPCILES